ncbi:Bug family tripartite tricarboxylate transporter substrate binding protein [Hydrogenophaga sp. BPS33]|uniref:Bug family tripartite tricarboxylate transporter substrate binding protein n=1 Tax=Hydrogenophaga sp. BPS33 TaxID=2651974 RepID=UPI00132016D5|nr:tripartite tricarboxylate transporter substrate binding protein [Hydrogenophaga sp. BPS33]QHE87797.1 tripartite tricarboxylate transporter substrate binding protein [Hydrogenophaga sp. BPS33]
MKRIHSLLLCLAAFASAPAPAWSQDNYPNAIVKIVVPFAAGGSTDLLARSLAERLGEAWKQPVIVENRAGAGGVIGAEYAAKAKPDGHTLLLGTVTTHAVAQTLYPNLRYDVQRDFLPVTELVTIPQILSVHPSLPVRSLAEFVAYAKAHPGEIPYNGSVGATPHMSMAMLATRANISLLPVPYKGSGPAMNDLIAGQLTASFDVVMTTLPHLQAGRLRALAVTSAQRSPLVPDIPTVAESGFPGYESDVWFGLFAPAGTPAAIVRKVSEDSRRALIDAAMRKKLEEAGFTIVASNPADFSRRVSNDIQKWRKVIIDGKIKIDK